jgi:hypothetical protein
MEPSLTDREKKSFDLAVETVKQLITVSCLVMALTVLTRHDAAEQSLLRKIILGASQASFGASTVGGLVSLMAMTGQLAGAKSPSVEGPAIKRLVHFQIICFMMGILCLVAIGLLIYA